MRFQESLYFIKINGMNPRASPGPLFRGKPRGMYPERFKSKEGVMAEIQWLHDMSVALARAKAERKPILLDFFNPG